MGDTKNAGHIHGLHSYNAINYSGQIMMYTMMEAGKEYVNTAIRRREGEMKDAEGRIDLLTSSLPSSLSQVMGITLGGKPIFTGTVNLDALAERAKTGRQMCGDSAFVRDLQSVTETIADARTVALQNLQNVDHPNYAIIKQEVEQFKLLDNAVRNIETATATYITYDRSQREQTSLYEKSKSFEKPEHAPMRELMDEQSLGGK